MGKIADILGYDDIRAFQMINTSSYPTRVSRTGVIITTGMSNAPMRIALQIQSLKIKMVTLNRLHPNNTIFVSI